MSNKKTLDETVHNFVDAKFILHIGSDSGFFFIGNLKDYDEQIDDISRAWGDYYRAKLDSSKIRIDRLMTEPIIAHKGEKPIEFSERLIRMGETLKNEVSTKSKLQPRVEHYKNMRERSVIDIYERDEENTLAIIVTGTEHGGFWDKSEWDAVDIHFPVFKQKL